MRSLMRQHLRKTPEKSTGLCPDSSFFPSVRRPIPSTKKLEQEIANEDRQLKRLTDRLAKLDDTHLDAVLAQAEEMGRQLAAKREQLKELQRASRRPKVKSVKEKDVVAALTQLRDLLQGDVGIAAQLLKALMGSGGRRGSASRDRGIVRLSVFGSVLRDDFDPSRSDIDVLADFKPEATRGSGFRFFGYGDELAGILGRKADFYRRSYGKTRCRLAARCRCRHSLGATP
ncbi:MAG: nucleotidyltransferase domain-containing protein [Planctomycetia bacterium]